MTYIPGICTKCGAPTRNGSLCYRHRRKCIICLKPHTRGGRWCEECGKFAESLTAIHRETASGNEDSIRIHKVHLSKGFTP